VPNDDDDDDGDVAAEVVQLDFVFDSQPFPSFERPGIE
jgi:hypothetical protein